ncbi:hypothetical protein Spith_1759 [Spirochaeta thermophila DSM 6578]|uniref:Metallo-beta-lactamase domain-containing protein n=1 Tax=Winmispira thermophila (strain ATCC 700085 / DSM 6578 / Z-1203) TaxID=869211 RepID=G0GC07_WINT7|nr:MBL fold metallo-hydrolase [Spirochaeta thermophila]AEJ62018.1 hypothetical protein Spith_1759 [Spirochaeta thermophila DSM 6578]
MTITPLTTTPPPLTRAGELALLFLGTGTAFSKRLYQNNILLVKNEQHLLVDCGTRGTQALHELGLSVGEIQHYLFTHSHADHIGGAEEIMLVNRYMKRRRPHLYIPRAYQRLLWNESLRGGSAYSERHPFKPHLNLEDFFVIHTPRLLFKKPRPIYQIWVGDMDILLFRTIHIPEQARSWKEAAWSTGLLIDRRILFTGDTRFDPEIITYFHEHYPLEVIFHDCQFFDGGVHASFEELCTLPDEIKAKTFLMHYGDDWERHRSRVEEAGFAGFARERTLYLFPADPPR